MTHFHGILILTDRCDDVSSLHAERTNLMEAIGMAGFFKMRSLAVSHLWHLSFPSPCSRNCRRPDAGDGEREDRGFHHRPQPLGLRSRRHREDHVLLQRGEPETHSLNIHALTSASTEIVLSLRKETNCDWLIYYCWVKTLMLSGIDGLFVVFIWLQCMYCVQTYD